MIPLHRAAAATLAWLGCGSAETTRDFASLNAEVREIVRGSCGSGAAPCHGPNPTARSLDFERLLESDTLWEAMADVQSCEYDTLPLVAPGEPERSWLMVKLTGQTDPDGRLRFDPDSSWVPAPDSCAVGVRGSYDFGTRMPEVGQLSPREIETFRAWILAGPPPTAQ